MAAHHHEHGDRRRLGLAAGVTGVFMVVEAIAGWWAGSLALIADAAHMLTGFASLTLAWARVAERPADWTMTFGFDRFSVLAAFVSGLALFAIASVIVWEAAERLVTPSEVMGLPMLVVAALGLTVKIVAFRLLHGGSGGLNIRSAALHVAGDIVGSVGAILAAVVILATGLMVADPVLSVLVSVLILGAAWWVVRESGRILLGTVPEGVDLRRLGGDLSRIKGVGWVHHLHTLAVTEKRPMITLHAELADGVNAAEVREALRRRLADKHSLVHTTIEIEEAGVRRRAPAGC